MADYAEACATFSIDELARETLSGSLVEGLNACVECCDRWATDGRAALISVAADGARRIVTFAELMAESSRFANLLTARGVGPGDVVAGMLPRTPELVVAILGTWRAGAVYQPLFTAFGPAAIASRIVGPKSSEAKLVLIDQANVAKLEDVPGRPPALVLNGGAPVRSGDGDFAAELAAQTPSFAPIMRKGSDPFILIFTSGTTGSPKGVACPLFALLQFAGFMRDGVDLRASDVYWCLADPGWALGMYSAITAPLLLGHATVLYDGGFSVESTVRVIRQLGVTNLIAAPTVFRMMRAAGEDAIAPIRGQLRAVTSGGEPLNPELNRWAELALASPIHEAYGQTEMGVNVVNHHGARHPARVGSVGLASPGWAFEVLNDELEPVAAGRPGVLAVDRTRSPLFFFGGYWRADTPAFQGDWYLTGDIMQRDADGYLSFVGRNDDLITSAGYRIGPTDIENVLMEHPAVAEAAVIGKPDAERSEVVKAFVVLRAGAAGSADLAEELRLLVRNRLSAHAYPREFAFVADLPKTPSGKVQRFVIRQREVAALERSRASR
jgi:acetyl-CoA synthetase